MRKLGKVSAVVMAAALAMSMGACGASGESGSANTQGGAQGNTGDKGYNIGISHIHGFKTWAVNNKKKQNQSTHFFTKKEAMNYVNQQINL